VASRGEKKAVQALDHDMRQNEKLVPFGILDVVSGLLTVMVGTSRDTSDFIVDSLQKWWNENEDRYSHIQQLVINLDNGPECSSHRTQFMKRMVEFSDQNNLEIVLTYYPPYHSKYNSVERCWGILERHWDGALLSSTTTVVKWIRSMTWKGTQPVVHLVEKVYDKGVTIRKKAFEPIANRLTRDSELPKYSVQIQPQPA